MVYKQHIINLRELLTDPVKENLDLYGIAHFESLFRREGIQYFSPFYSDSYIYLLVKSGNAHITINYDTYEVRNSYIIVLTPLHIIQFTHISHDFCCSFLLVDESFMDIPSMEKVFRQLTRSVQQYNKPVMHLCDSEFTVLTKCLNHIQEKIEQTNHLLHHEIIQNSFVAFLLEWINIYETLIHRDSSHVVPNHYSAQILKDFISILKTHFKEQHHVSFYAEKLNISPQYLTLIVKKFTGQTIKEFIYDMLYSEARILLNRSDLSIQQISGELHFSDPSAFCKFFKRRSGITPMKYRNK